MYHALFTFQFFGRFLLLRAHPQAARLPRSRCVGHAACTQGIAHSLGRSLRQTSRRRLIVSGWMLRRCLSGLRICAHAISVWYCSCLRIYCGLAEGREARWQIWETEQRGTANGLIFFVVSPCCLPHCDGCLWTLWGPQHFRAAHWAHCGSADVHSGDPPRPRPLRNVRSMSPSALIVGVQGIQNCELKVIRPLTTAYSAESLSSVCIGSIPNHGLDRTPAAYVCFTCAPDGVSLIALTPSQRRQWRVWRIRCSVP